MFAINPYAPFKRLSGASEVNVLECCINHYVSPDEPESLKRALEVELTGW
jgi:hypothetical protein